MNCKTIRCYFVVAILACMASFINCDANNEAENIFRHFCAPLTIDATPISTVDGDEYFCDCEAIVSPLVGKPAIKIDCTLNDHIANLTNKLFGAEKLPPKTALLVLSFQLFTEIPEFFGDSLKHLDMSYNRIRIVKNLNFIHVKYLERLDLHDNEISDIEPNAFSLLSELNYLDLSSNRLVILPANVFSTLVSLETLVLSSNEGFGRLMGRNATNSSLTLLYLQLGVTKHLKHLELERCNLTNFNLLHGDDLESVNLGFNEIRDPTKIEFPATEKLKRLELSENPIRYLSSYSLSRMQNLEELLMEDLPYFGEVDEFAFARMSRLRKLSFEGCKNLSTFHPNAFGDETVNIKTNLTLEILNLKGCNLRTLNFSLITVFENLKELALDGNPFNCDCEVKWITELQFDTDLRCSRPEQFHGILLSEVTETDELKCSNASLFMKKLLNSIILLVLLIICSIVIWCFLQQLKPDNRRKRFSKVGPESPYQRVTIEPNRAEYSLY